MYLLFLSLRYSHRFLCNRVLEDADPTRTIDRDRIISGNFTIDVYNHEWGFVSKIALFKLISLFKLFLRLFSNHHCHPVCTTLLILEIGNMQGGALSFGEEEAFASRARSEGDRIVPPLKR